MHDKVGCGCDADVEATGGWRQVLEAVVFQWVNVPSTLASAILST